MFYLLYFQLGLGISLRYLHKGLVILGVVDDNELQTALGGHEIAEVNAFHHLVVGRVYGHDFGAAAAYGLLQRVHNAHVQGPQQTLSKCIYYLMLFKIFFNCVCGMSGIRSFLCASAEIIKSNQNYK